MVTILQVEGLLVPGQMCSLQPFVKLRVMGASFEEVEVAHRTNEEVIWSSVLHVKYFGQQVTSKDELSGTETTAVRLCTVLRALPL